MTVLIEVPDPRPGKEGETAFLPHQQATVALLGLVSAHWNIKQRAETTGDILGDVRMALNSGMAVVTPAEKIRELLMDDPALVADRVSRAREMKRQHQKDRAMTTDSALSELPWADAPAN